MDEVTYIEQQIAEHLQAAEALRASAAVLRAAADLIRTRLQAGQRLYTLGNGGSAADAQHIAAELVGRFRVDKEPLPAVALTTDSSILTAVGNDYGYEQVFERQVRALVGAGDVLWALSVSGRSPNVIAALRAARERGAHVIGFTGRAGRPLRELTDICLVVDDTDSARVQEIHQLAYHVICGLIEQHTATAPPGGGGTS